MKQTLWKHTVPARSQQCCIVLDRLLHGIVLVLLQSVAVVLSSFSGPWHLLNAQDLTPRVDTLWTKLTTQTPWVEFQASAMGGSPQGYIVVTIRREWPQDKFLVEYDIQTGQEIRYIRSGHYGDVQHMSFARNANVFSTAEPGLIKVWRWPELEVIREFRGPIDPTTYIAAAGLLSSDGSRLFDARAGVMYNVQTGNTLWTLTRSWGISSFNDWAAPKITPDDHYIIVQEGGLTPLPNQYLVTWGLLLDAATGDSLGGFGGGSGGDMIRGMGISDDGRSRRDCCTNCFQKTR